MLNSTWVQFVSSNYYYNTIIFLYVYTCMFLIQRFYRIFIKKIPYKKVFTKENVITHSIILLIATIGSIYYYKPVQLEFKMEPIENISYKLGKDDLSEYIQINDTELQQEIYEIFNQYEVERNFMNRNDLPDVDSTISIFLIYKSTPYFILINKEQTTLFNGSKSSFVVIDPNHQLYNQVKDIITSYQ